MNRMRTGICWDANAELGIRDIPPCPLCGYRIRQDSDLVVLSAGGALALAHLRCAQEVFEPTVEPSIQSMGGKARAAKLSPAERSAIARKASRARWKRNDK